MTLIKKSCTPCQKGATPLTSEEIHRLISSLSSHWRVVDHHHLSRHFVFPDFSSALEFTNYIGEISEEEGHHPDIFLTWGKVTLTIYTHKIDGLHENDFILAAKCDQLFNDL